MAGLFLCRYVSSPFLLLDPVSGGLSRVLGPGPLRYYVSEVYFVKRRVEHPIEGLYLSFGSIRNGAETLIWARKIVMITKNTMAKRHGDDNRRVVGRPARHNYYLRKGWPAVSKLQTVLGRRSWSTVDI
ncbi:hypothetical protein BOTNAR_0435g00060 [Botryotinia narcissicola]|uniref:Uncharacterized protein n=1 Tax=Botryotinia narcissicola TaxID=278944 RepID=A0A4Z1HRG9_9HELO|nr:hypothetical protein BOTNAR_0435g00060 [Botryotinia narcissicola]